MIEYDEAHAVEASKSFLRTHPQIAIRSAGDGLSGALRQSLQDLPVVEDVLAQLQGRIQGVRRESHHNQEHRDMNAQRSPDQERWVLLVLANPRHRYSETERGTNCLGPPTI